MIHGDGLELREAVCRVLAEEKSAKACFRYACCGLADQLARSGDAVSVQPKGCGHRLCPRCGRRRGGRYAKRILGWLANRPHGDVLSMVLTQRVVKGESLKAARARMAPKQRSYMRWLTRRGLIGAMTAVHVVWSSRAEGWHYHVHVLVELPAGTMTVRELLDQWVKEGGEGEHRVGEKQARMVVSAGGPIAELREDGGDTDFWSESPSAVARSVQYPLRDLASGVNASKLGGDREQMDKCARELVRDAQGWKMFRAWGDWRQPPPPLPSEENRDEQEKADAPAAPGSPDPLGTVGRLWRRARAGDEVVREVFRRLEASVKNDSDFGVRLVRYCRLCQQGP